MPSCPADWTDADWGFLASALVTATWHPHLDTDHAWELVEDVISDHCDDPRGFVWELDLNADEDIHSITIDPLLVDAAEDPPDWTLQDWAVCANALVAAREDGHVDRERSRALVADIAADQGVTSAELILKLE